MRCQRRRRYRCELWRVVARLSDRVETAESMARLAARKAWLREQLPPSPPTTERQSPVTTAALSAVIDDLAARPTNRMNAWLLDAYRAELERVSEKGGRVTPLEASASADLIPRQCVGVSAHR
jgi:hypothetical protein